MAPYMGPHIHRTNTVRYVRSDPLCTDIMPIHYEKLPDNADIIPTHYDTIPTHTRDALSILPISGLHSHYSAAHLRRPFMAPFAPTPRFRPHRPDRRPTEQKAEAIAKLLRPTAQQSSRLPRTRLISLTHIHTDQWTCAGVGL
jgi:hypothetical protein